MTPNAPTSTEISSRKNVLADGGPLVSQPTVDLVTGQGYAYIAVREGFYDLDVRTQNEVWNRAQKLAVEAGWVAPENDDLSVVDEDGTERLPLVPYCRLMSLECENRCGR
jgi:hypothetical protein